jgi:hypothetical protein
VATAGAGKNGGGRRKQRQQRRQTTINQKAAAISAETAIVAAAETAATETAAGGGGGADSGRVVLELSRTGTYKEYPYQEFHRYRARVQLLVLRFIGILHIPVTHG